MRPSFVKAAAVAPIAVIAIGLTCVIGAGGARAENLPDVLGRYGVSRAYVQIVGIHHGVHIVAVAKGSYAEKDGLKPHDVIARVNGEGIRSLEHLTSAMERDENEDGEVALTVIREGSLTNHEIVAHLRGRPAEKRDDRRDGDR